MQNPNPLPRSIEATSISRPVKIAFLVPPEESRENHMILDGLFHEAYSRWAGAYSLIVPTSKSSFLEQGFDDWLRFYDPDFIYTYVDIDVSLIERIDRLISPIAIIKHKIYNAEDADKKWRSYIPNLSNFIEPVSSITTVPSPISKPTATPLTERESDFLVLTQYGLDPTNRFIRDNFGTSFYPHRPTHGAPGLFKTLCLVPPDLPESTNVGAIRCTSLLEALSFLTDRKAHTIAEFSMAHSESIPRAQPYRWSNAFHIFIGDSVIDRINFWNCRSLSPRSTAINSLVIDQRFFDDAYLTEQLGKYLNRTNFLGSSRGPNAALLHSKSVSQEKLFSIQKSLSPYTWNSISVENTLNSNPIPEKRDLKNGIFSRLSNSSTLKLTEDSSNIVAAEPFHFTFISPQLKGLARGQWVVDLLIERHNSLSEHSNVTDQWILPRRKNISRAFTSKLAKPSLHGALSVIPSSNRFDPLNRALNEKYTYDLNLPDDETFFRYLVLDFNRYEKTDIRNLISSSPYKDLSISDKGQNLRGVISLLGNLSTAYKLFTNMYWRKVLNEAREDSVSPLTFDLNKLKSFIPNDRENLEKLSEALNFSDLGRTKDYLNRSLLDTLEHLIKKDVFHQVASWRCAYCGHTNSRSFDNMKVRNECEICRTEYFTPIDIGWKYELNNFVHRSLIKSHGLPVLWTLGFLQEQHYMNSFWYLPEVDLFEEYDAQSTKNEIDVLCISDGLFYAAEAKLSASLFLNKDGEIEKFIKVMRQIKPDIAIISFLRYAKDEEEVPIIKIKLRKAMDQIRESLSPDIEIRVLVAEDFQSFNEFPCNLGWFGRRVRDI
jgi:hypothetical protein